jgi:membrane-associated PAP2 superfamily phosphatase
MGLEARARARWWLRAFALPLLVLATVSVLLRHSPFDRASLAPFFDAQSSGFPLRRSWFFEDVLHVGGRALVAGATCTLMLAAGIGALRPPRRACAMRCAYLVSCVLLTVALAGLWKELAAPVTPWNSAEFGGRMPSGQGGTSLEALFGSPGAHAAAGYAWVSLYFVGASLGTRRRSLWLAPGLALGTLFAFGQHVRGAHPPSHEALSLALAWSVAGFTAARFRARGWLSWVECTPATRPFPSR